MSGYENHGFDNKGNSAVTYIADVTDTESSSDYLILDPGLSDSPSEQANTANASWTGDILVNVWSLTGNNTIDPVWDGWDASPISCKKITDPAGKIARRGWLGTDCIMTVVAKGHSATDVTPASTAPFFLYSTGWTGVSEVRSSPPGVSGASSGPSASAGWFGRTYAAVLSAFSRNALLSTATTTIVLNGNGFDTSSPNEVWLTPVAGSDNDAVELDVSTDDPSSLSFDVPTDLVAGYQVQVRTQSSDLSAPMSFASLLGLAGTATLTATDTTATSTQLSWTTNLTGNQTYSLTEAFPIKYLLWTGTATSTFLWSGLSPNTTYCASLTISGSQTAATTTCFSTLAGHPISVPELTIGAVTNWGMRFDWSDADTDIESYSLIETKESKNINNSIIPALTVLKSGDGSLKQYYPIDFNTHTQYCAVVVAKNTSGDIATSSEACATTASSGGGGFMSAPLVPISVPAVPTDPGVGGEVPGGGPRSEAAP